MGKLKDMQIDASVAFEVNKKYYENNDEIPFLTQAKDNPRYVEALTFFLYKIFDDASNRKDRTIRVVELGARGIYFEEKVYSNIKNLDIINNTNIAENIEYKIVDISPVAIQAAREEYKNKSPNLFTTEFYVADVLNKEALSSVGGNNYIVILNELIDDLPQMVVTRKGDAYYEVLYKPVLDLNYGQIRLARNGLRKLSDEEAKMFADYEGMLSYGKLAEGYAITFSPVLDKLIENISMLLSFKGKIFIHDYFIDRPIPLKFAHTIRRIYGYLRPEALYYNIENSKVQITADVNLQQLAIALKQKGFDAQAIQHRFFINEYIGIKELSWSEIAASLNATPKEEKRMLLERISKHIPVNTNAPDINMELFEALKSVFRKIELQGQHFYAPDVDCRIDIIEDKDKRNILNELYKLCRENYPIISQYADVYASRRK